VDGLAERGRQRFHLLRDRAHRRGSRTGRAAQLRRRHLYDLGFLVSAGYSPAGSSGTITYTDGRTQTYGLTVPDWFSTGAPSGGAVAANSAYLSIQGNTTDAHAVDIVSVDIPLTSGKTAASVALPPGSALASGVAALHVFDLAFGRPD
jgi:hypothetical protein